MNAAAVQKALAPLLRPLGAAYAACMAARRAAYEAGLLPSFSPPRPVVSVGNICWGGTGKTPLVHWLLRWCGAHGLSAAVLTRGYGAKPSRLPLLVRPGHTAAEAGDEPLMLARQNPDAAVLVDPVRRRAGHWAEARLSPHLYLLDDGFQHLAVRRDLDIVVLRPADLTGEWGRTIPAGSWREGAGALARAHAFCVKAEPELFDALGPQMERRLIHYGVPVFGFRLAPRGLVRVGRGLDPRPAEQGAATRAHLDGAPYVLASGVGEPAQVHATATRFFGYPPLRHRIFPDHHPYGPGDVRSLAAEGCAVVCTPKDAVKLAPLCGEGDGRHDGSGEGASPPDLWAFDLVTEFGPALWSATNFPEWWAARWTGLSAARRN
ncbi:tetraacyldisaccharide 4'-kinase [Nitratidesulfovibrio sp. D1]|uniref:tetraacyldisaccharide 4'-kinase n=1 Tax=Nitratidesulfovibrio sp. D1 TaxID=3440151 RepID=UPI003EBDB8BE